MMRTSVETRVQGITPKALISSKFNFITGMPCFHASLNSLIFNQNGISKQMHKDTT